jgi:hypothetical protein
MILLINMYASLRRYQSFDTIKEHFVEFDAVVCIGPNDYSLLETLIPNVKTYLSPRRVYIITHPSIVEKYQSLFDAHFVSETSFPFGIDYIHEKFNQRERSGWYLQQLLKLYAPLVIKELSDHYVIVDADVRFNKPLRFFGDGIIKFNTGTEYYLQYFQHMEKLVHLGKQISQSGICHLMPMKRHIIEHLIKYVEEQHQVPFWKAFLDKVDPVHYAGSGASEYEILLNYTLVHFPDLVEITPLSWQNTSNATPNPYYDYEAYHWYER